MYPACAAGLRSGLAGERFAIGYLSDYLREPLPAPAYPVDVTGGIGDQGWGMLGNGPDPTCTTYPNGVGDCTFAGPPALQDGQGRGLP